MERGDYSGHDFNVPSFHSVGFIHIGLIVFIILVLYLYFQSDNLYNTEGTTASFPQHYGRYN